MKKRLLVALVLLVAAAFPVGVVTAMSLREPVQNDEYLAAALGELVTATVQLNGEEVTIYMHPDAYCPDAWGVGSLVSTEGEWVCNGWFVTVEEAALSDRYSAIFAGRHTHEFLAFYDYVFGYDNRNPELFAAFGEGYVFDAERTLCDILGFPSPYCGCCD
jgi:hypothetical protein